MAREHLLLIDANEESAAVRELALRQAGYSVARAVDCDQAWHLFDESVPSLIVFDLASCKAPEGFLAKLAAQRATSSLNLPCVFLCEHATCSELPEELRPSVQECLVKPVYLRDLISRVNLTLESKRRALWSKHDGGRSRYSGELSDLGVVDLLQTIDVCKKSGVVALKTPAGDGEIWFKNGALVDASFGKLQAEAAVYRMIRLDQGSFGVQFKSVRRAKAMSSSTQQVLLEGLSRLDKWHRFCEQLPSLDEALIADPSYLKREGDSSSPNADVTALLRRFKNRKSIREVLQESRRSDLELLETISEVYFCGALIPASTVEPLQNRKASRSGPIAQDSPKRPVARTQRLTSDGVRPRSMTARMTSRTGPLSPPEVERRGRPRSATYTSMGSSRSGSRRVARTLVIPYGGEEATALPLDPPALETRERRRPSSATMIYHEDDQSQAQVPFTSGKSRRARTRANDYEKQMPDAANAPQEAGGLSQERSTRGNAKADNSERSRREAMLAQLEDSSRGLAELDTREHRVEPLVQEPQARRIREPVNVPQEESQAGLLGAIFGCVVVVALVLGQPFLVAGHASVTSKEQDHDELEQEGHAVLEGEVLEQEQAKQDLGAPAAPIEPIAHEPLRSCDPSVHESTPPL